MNIDAFSLAQLFIGIKEVKGDKDNPFILWLLQSVDQSIQHDEIAWCSAFPNKIHELLKLERSKSLGARSWLLVGGVVEMKDARVNDIVIFKRGLNPAPPSVIKAPGHVGFYAGHDKNTVYSLGGNQGDSISIAPFPIAQVLGVRRVS